MTIRDTKLTTTGNSAAVRLPREILRVSGIADKSKVTLEAKQGKIIISKSKDPRAGWADQIRAVMKEVSDPTQQFSNMNAAAANDGLDDLPWDGPSFEEWQKANDELP